MKRIRLIIGCLCAALLLLATTAPAFAAEKKKKKGGSEESQDLFDALDLGGDTGGLGDLKQATKGVGPADARKDESLQIRQKKERGDGKITVHRVFAAPKISMVNKKCVAKPKRVEFFVTGDFPFKVDGFSVCAQMSGGRARAMPMSVLITTGRGKKIGHAESVVDFSGKTMIDHTIDFPPLEFPEAGVYRYVIDIEGNRVANMPLFEVRPEDASQIPE